jgi:hypothetical protein
VWILLYQNARANEQACHAAHQRKDLKQ